MKIAINRCFGGFGLSHKAFLKLIERGWRVTVYSKDYEYADPSAQIVDGSSIGGYKPLSGFSYYSFTRDRDCKSLRTNPDVLSVIEELGKEANGPCSDLRIVEIPDDIEWTITDYDGLEQVEEVHRVWS
ncbi:hypothetical protein [Paenibacillus oceani]|uniref:Uncharacterized protein n=1 Tax=Paenibacillus oceani TaxID=2772510 RepID=A0A927C937_9BACL|nr:hypothetical protein [Paenibacillus oceani]MBD2861625.1 hypothetical protein [Paenibacillus oceani]